MIAEGISASELVRRYATAAMGAGRVSFPDFVKLRLFEPGYADRTALRAVIGERRGLDLCARVNYRTDWFGMLTNKVAQQSYLAAFGLPTIPFQAIYMPGVESGPTLLGDLPAMIRFLGQEAQYPLFGKPSEGHQSLGALALSGSNAARTELHRVDGVSFPLAETAGQIAASYPEGYTFQSLVKPNPQIGALSRNRLATVRFLTARRPEGANILRAAMKIPAGANAADNFWRPGNLLAHVDISSGRLGRAVVGTGLEMAEVAEHPDTGTTIAGFIHPDWKSMCDLALAGAHVMRDVPLIGWDIALSERGPVIVEMNATPDLFIPQFIDRRGLLDVDFIDFVATQKGFAAEYKRLARASLAAF